MAQERAASPFPVSISQHFSLVRPSVAGSVPRHLSSSDQKVIFVVDEIPFLLVEFDDLGRPRPLIDVFKKLLQRVLVTLRLALNLCHRCHRYVSRHNPLKSLANRPLNPQKHVPWW